VGPRERARRGCGGDEVPPHFLSSPEGVKSFFSENLWSWALAAMLSGDKGIDAGRPARHTIHMKRTNLVLDEDLLAEAQRVSGERTYSGTVLRALQEFVRRARARQILTLEGSGAWRGDLAMMRGDRRPGSRRRHGSR
jgi:Arc/MetJ family transcription regulator